jgi:alcohol dehydrogenase, propanol-preferring
MKAATLTSPQEIRKRPLRIGEVAKLEPKPGHVLLRVRVCGVCRTDLHIVEGDLPALRPGAFSAQIPRLAPDCLLRHTV